MSFKIKLKRCEEEPAPVQRTTTTNSDIQSPTSTTDRNVFEEPQRQPTFAVFSESPSLSQSLTTAAHPQQSATTIDISSLEVTALHHLKFQNRKQNEQDKTEAFVHQVYQ
jgi:hypothetical protein